MDTPRAGLLAALLLAIAASAAITMLPSRAAASEEVDSIVMSSPGFLAGHPDLRWRREAFAAYESGRHAAAVTAFRTAAKYADKPSQGMLSEMYWNGDGVPRDRALGYAWMHVAAERGPDWAFDRRDGYLYELTAQERARALELADELMAEFGDAVARPRLANQIRRTSRESTGSRVGSGAGKRVQLVSTEGATEVRGADFDDRRYWEPELYFELQDEEWARFGD